MGCFSNLIEGNHLKFDLVGGVLLAESPWLFGNADLVFWPHLFIGDFEVMASLITSTQPSWQGLLGSNTG